MANSRVDRAAALTAEMKADCSVVLLDAETAANLADLQAGEWENERDAYLAELSVEPLVDGWVAS